MIRNCLCALDRLSERTYPLLRAFLDARRARDKLRRQKQTTSVSKYLSEFGNITLAISEVNEGKRVDWFVDGLKYRIRVGVPKTLVEFFEEAFRIA